MFLLLIVVTAVIYMYGTTEDTVSDNVLTTFFNFSTVGGLRRLSSNLTYQTVDKILNGEASPLDVIKYEGSRETKAIVDSSGTHTMVLEFPGMPDPCASPRRNTGVEDILCMVCFYRNTVNSGSRGSQIFPFL